MPIGTGGVKLEDRVLDLGLNVLDTETTHIHVCSAQPTSYSDTLTKTLGNKNWGAGNAFGAPGAWASGRKTSSVAITDGSITTSGTVACWAAVDATNTRLHAAGDLSGGGVVTAGQAFSLASFDVQMVKAAAAGGAAQVTTWDTVKKGTHINLSAAVISNQHAQGSTTGLVNECVFSTTSKADGSGKFYVELNSQYLDNVWLMGLCDSTFITNSDVNGETVGDAANSFGWRGDGSGTLQNAFNRDNLPNLVGVPSANQTMQMAIDMVARKMWIGLNNNYDIGNPAAGTGQTFSWISPFTLFICFSPHTAGGYEAIIRCNTLGGQVYAPPAGFSTWDAN